MRRWGACTLVVCLVLAVTGSPVAASAESGVERLAGSDRFATAAQISRWAFPDGAQTVYVATAYDFPDALAGGAAAASTGPLLLVGHAGIPSATREELRRLGPRQIVLLGGRGSISDEVEEALVRTGARTLRIAGSSRYETAALIARHRFQDEVPVAYVATGTGFADALAAGAAAGAQDGPVLLTAPTSLSAATREALAQLRPGRIVLAGGTSAVSRSVEAELARFAPVHRVSGANRFETAATLAASAFPTARTVFVATGHDFPDALAGGAVAGGRRAPVLLVARDTVPEAAVRELRRLRPERIVVLGGARAVSSAVASRLAELTDRPSGGGPAPSPTASPSPSPLPTPPSRARVVRVPGTPSAAVVSSDGTTAFVASPGTGAVHVIDLPAALLRATIPVGSRPVDLDLHPDGSRLYVATEQATSVAVIDTARHVVIDRIDVGDRPSSLAIGGDGRALVAVRDELPRFREIDLERRTWRGRADAAHTLFDVAWLVANADRSAIGIVELGTHSGARIFDVASDRFATHTHRQLTARAAAVAPDGRLLAGGPVTIEIDPLDGHTRGSVTGGGAPAAFSPDGRWAYRLSGSRVEVLDTERYVVAGHHQLWASVLMAQSAISPDGDHLVVPTEMGIEIVDLTRPAERDPQRVPRAPQSAPGSRFIPVEGAPFDSIATTEDGSVAYLASSSTNEVIGVSLVSGERLLTVPVGAQPRDLDLAPDEGRLYVANSGSHSISVVDVPGGREVSRPSVPPHSVDGRYDETLPWDLAVTADGEVLVGLHAALLAFDPSAGTFREPDGFGWLQPARPAVTASGDRRTVAIVDAGWSRGPMWRYDVASGRATARGHFTAREGVAVDMTGDRWLVGAELLIDGRDGHLAGSLSGAAPAAAISPDGRTGYRAIGGAVERIDLDRMLPTGTYPLIDAPIGSALAVTADGRKLVVPTRDGIEVVDVTGPPAPPSSPPLPEPASGEGWWFAPVAGAPLGDVVIDHLGRYAYATNPSRNQVEVIDLIDRRVLAPIPVGSRPMGVDLSPVGDRLYVANSGSWTVSVVDTATRREVVRHVVPEGRYPDDDRAFSVAALADGDLAVSLQADNRRASGLLVLDPSTGTVEHRWQEAATWLTASSDRSRVAIDTDRDFPYLMWLQASDRRLVPAQQFETPTPVLTAVDGTGARFWAGGGPVVDTDHLHQAGLVEGPTGQVAMRRDGLRGFRIAPGSRRLETVDLERFLVDGTLPMHDSAAAPGVAGQGRMRLSSDDRTLVIPTRHGVQIMRTTVRPTPLPEPVLPDAQTGEGHRFVPVAGAPLGQIIVDDARGRAYAANPRLNQVEVLDLRTATMLPAIPVGSGPVAMDLTPEADRLVVANGHSDTLSVVDLDTGRESARMVLPSSETWRRFNERPVGIAFAADGSGIVARHGSTRPLRLTPDLTAGSWPPPYGIRAADASPVASRDRTSITVVDRWWSTSDIALVTPQDGGWLQQRQLPDFLAAAAVNHDASRRLIGSAEVTLLLDRDGAEIGRVPRSTRSDLGGSLAIDHDGVRGYRLEPDRVEVLDLSAFTVSASRMLLDHASSEARERSVGMGITRSDDLLVVPTLNGIELVTVTPVSRARPAAP